MKTNYQVGQHSTEKEMQPIKADPFPPAHFKASSYHHVIHSTRRRDYPPAFLLPQLPVQAA